jgi:hypothetical protein
VASQCPVSVRDPTASWRGPEGEVGRALPGAVVGDKFQGRMHSRTMREQSSMAGPGGRGQQQRPNPGTCCVRRVDFAPVPWNLSSGRSWNRFTFQKCHAGYKVENEFPKHRQY